MARIALLLLDGIGDRPSPELDGRTPLESARTPVLDRLARRGRLGLVDPLGLGIATDADARLLALLGFDAAAIGVTRGTLEALGAGLDLAPGDLAWRLDFATAGSGRRIADRRAGGDLTPEEASELAAEIRGRVVLRSHRAAFEMRATTGHRAVVRIRCDDGPLASDLSNPDPGYERSGAFSVPLAAAEAPVPIARALRGHEDDPASIRAADLSNEFLWKGRLVLESADVNARRRTRGAKPANFLLARGAGGSPRGVAPFESATGRRIGIVALRPLDRGVARLAGFDAIEPPAPTGNRTRDLGAVAHVAAKALEGLDAVVVRVDAADVASRGGRPLEKRDAIETIDAAFLAPLAEAFDGAPVVWALAACHSTPFLSGVPAADPVPLLVSGVAGAVEARRRFSEASAVEGALGRPTGRDLLPLLFGTAAEAPSEKRRRSTKAPRPKDDSSQADKAPRSAARRRGARVRGARVRAAATRLATPPSKRPRRSRANEA